jgi:hypothetical protein
VKIMKMMKNVKYNIIIRFKKKYMSVKI